MVVDTLHMDAEKWRGSVCCLPARQARFVYDNIHMSWWWTHYIWMRKNDGAVSCVHLVVWCTSDVSAFDVSFDWYKGLFLHVGLCIQASSFDVLCQSNSKSLQLMSCVHLVVWWTSDISAFDVSFDLYEGLFLHVGLCIQASSFDVLCQSNLTAIDVVCPPGRLVDIVSCSVKPQKERVSYTAKRLSTTSVLILLTNYYPRCPPHVYWYFSRTTTPDVHHVCIYFSRTTTPDVHHVCIDTSHELLPPMFNTCVRILLTNYY